MLKTQRLLEHPLGTHHDVTSSEHVLLTEAYTATQLKDYWSQQSDGYAHCCMERKLRLLSSAYEKRRESSRWNMYDIVYGMSLQKWCHPLRGFIWNLQSPWSYSPSSSPAHTPPGLNLQGVMCDMNSNFPKWYSTLTHGNVSHCQLQPNVSFFIINYTDYFCLTLIKIGKWSKSQLNDIQGLMSLANSANLNIYKYIFDLFLN